MKKILALVMFLAAVMQAAYWELGYGSYGDGSCLDVARFDWSCINFGNVSADMGTVERCNRILSYNPRHRFLVRLWPILGTGTLKQNRKQLTLFDYCYRPESRKAMFRELDHQLDLLTRNLSDPKALAAASFLEELPMHITQFIRFKRLNDPKNTKPVMPLEIIAFKKEIEAELGMPFDPRNRSHMNWWGDKYLTMLGDIYRHVKERVPGIKVFYWQMTNFLTAEMVKEYKPGILPFTYGELLKKTGCDGIFGYPNNDAIWKRDIQDIAGRHGCLFFSQISLPGRMRLMQFDECLKLARWKNPGNMGTFFYVGSDLRDRPTYNLYPESKRLGAAWDYDMNYQHRHVGYRYKIGMDVVEKALRPRGYWTYDLNGKKAGEIFTPVFYLHNPRTASWYGGHAEEAAITVKARLVCHTGVQFAGEEAAAVQTVRLAGDEFKLLTCWPLKLTGDPQKVRFAVSLSYEKSADQPLVIEGRGASADHALTRELSFSSNEPRQIFWGNAGRKLTGIRLAVLHPSGVVNPRLVFEGGRKITIPGNFAAGSHLELTGKQARLVSGSLFSPKVRRFYRKPGQPPMVCAKSYTLLATPQQAIRKNQKFRFGVQAQCGKDAILQVNAEFRFKAQDGKTAVKTNTLVYSATPSKNKDLEFSTPDGDWEKGTLRLCFYRARNKGVITLDSFDLQTVLEQGKCTELSAPLPVLSLPLRIEYEDDTRVSPSCYVRERPLVQMQLF